MVIERKIKVRSLERLNGVYQSAEKIFFDHSSNIVLMSDCHRGDGSFADNFSKNQNIYFAALNYYYKNEYTYIELGDGDELWENNEFSNITEAHSDIFWLLSLFYKKHRLYLIYGNHDMVKKDPQFVKENMYQYFEEKSKRCIPLFKGIKIHEGIILIHKKSKGEIFLVHGHQVDFMNDQLWKLSRFLVSYLWRPLELFGLNVPTSPAKNYKKKIAIEHKLQKWVVKNRHMLITGHTHRPVYPDTEEVPYFNDGSCVHPRCITAIEIANDFIYLVKWCVKTKQNGSLYVAREVLEGPTELKEFFSYEKK